MQLKNSTDYAIRIVCYLAAQERMVSTSELSRKLNVSANYVPKIAKKLKNAKIVTACEGTNGGYMLAKQQNWLKRQTSEGKRLEGQI